MRRVFLGVALEVRHGLLGDGRIRMDRVRTRVLRDTGGWYIVRDESGWGDARVLYRDVQDLAVIQWSGVVLRVPFHGGVAEFVWDGRTYQIGSMIGGAIHIRQEGRLVAEGYVTVAGLRLGSVASELLPIIRPLAWGLTLRSEAIARQDDFSSSGAG